MHLATELNPFMVSSMKRGVIDFALLRVTVSVESTEAVDQEAGVSLSG